MPRSARALVGALAVGSLVAALVGCTAQQGPEAVSIVDAAAQDPVPVDITPAAAPPRPAWAIDPADPGLRGRSLAEIRDRPGLLADRRLPSPDLLPPPPDGRFDWKIHPITPSVRERMGTSWSEQCPVHLRELRHLTLTFRGFDGEPHTGELVVNARVAHTVVEVFRRLYEADFPIEEMRLVTSADHTAPKTGDGNVTAAYNCRRARGQKRWSAHAHGTSVDINPFQNPYIRRGVVVPELASAYVDRARVRPGMLTPDGPAVRAFAEAGWVWGGDWSYSKDYMHFSTDGT